jgi:hypothetical protein
MATVPTYGAPKVQSTLAPRARWQAAPTAASEGAGVGEAVAGLGAQAAELGLTLYQQFQARADEIRYRDIGDTVARWEIERRTDPQTGWLTRRGVAALGLVDTIDQEITQLRGRLLKDLAPRQRVTVEQLIDARQADLRRWATAWSVDQLEQHDQERHGSYVRNAIQNGIAYSTRDLDRAALERDRILAETVEWGRRNGQSAEAIADAGLKATTQLHRGVVLQLAVAGQDVAAQRYYDRVKDEIDGTTRTELEEQIATASTSGVALRAAEMIWRQRGPKHDADPIELDVMEEDARVAFRDQPKILEATIAYLRERKAGVDVGRTQRKNAIAGPLRVAVADGRSLPQIRQMPEFLKAPPELQVEIVDAVLARAEREANRAAAIERRASDAESRAFTRESRAYTRQQRAEAEKTERGWAQFWALSQPEVLSQLSDNALNAKRGELGDDLVNRLFTLKRRVDTPEALREAEIDTNQFNTIADQAGVNPYGSGGSTDVARQRHQARLGQLRDAVESAIDVEQRGRGNKPLTREEKARVMEEIIHQEVMLDTWGPWNTRRIAAMVLADERGVAYVPMQEISERAKADFLTYMRGLPGNARYSDRDLLLLYRDRLERAYAVRLMGGTRAEIQAMLKGESR